MIATSHLFCSLSMTDHTAWCRIKKSNSAGEQLKEAQAINKSLSALGDVISALASEAVHIPYRNHKLTMLMSDSLGGTAKTLMFVNVSPTDSNVDETNVGPSFEFKDHDEPADMCEAPGLANSSCASLLSLFSPMQTKTRPVWAGC